MNGYYQLVIVYNLSETQMKLNATSNGDHFLKLCTNSYIITRLMINSYIHQRALHFEQSTDVRELCVEAAVASNL